MQLEVACCPPSCSTTFIVCVDNLPIFASFRVRYRCGLAFRPFYFFWFEQGISEFPVRSFLFSNEDSYRRGLCARRPCGHGLSYNHHEPVPCAPRGCWLAEHFGLGRLEQDGPWPTRVDRASRQCVP